MDFFFLDDRFTGTDTLLLEGFTIGTVDNNEDWVDTVVSKVSVVVGIVGVSSSLRGSTFGKLTTSLAIVEVINDAVPEDDVEAVDTLGLP